MKISDLRDGYQRARSSPISRLDPHDINGIPFIIGQTDWVRIMLIRQAKDGTEAIEVELSMPERIGKMDLNADQTQAQLAVAIEAIVEHMHYLNRLSQAGFQLDVIEDDFLWTATLEITAQLDEQLFDILLPP